MLFYIKTKHNLTGHFVKKMRNASISLAKKGARLMCQSTLGMFIILPFTVPNPLAVCLPIPR